MLTLVEEFNSLALLSDDMVKQIIQTGKETTEMTLITIIEVMIIGTRILDWSNC